MPVSRNVSSTAEHAVRAAFRFVEPSGPMCTRMIPAALRRVAARTIRSVGNVCLHVETLRASSRRRSASTKSAKQSELLSGSCLTNAATLLRSGTKREPSVTESTELI